MEVFKGIERGTNYFFGFVAQNSPGLCEFLAWWIPVGLYVLAGIFLIAVTAAWLKGKKRLVFSALAIVVTGIAVEETLRHTVASPRPQRSLEKKYVPESEARRSFPSRPVFLSTLVLCLSAFLLSAGMTSTASRIALYGLVALSVVAVCMGQFILALGYLTDILGGLSGGLGLALLARWIGRENAEAREVPAATLQERPAV